jgi:hypothetical protein
LLLDALHRPTNIGELGLGDWRASITAAVSQVPSLRALGQELLREGQGRPVLTVHGDLQPANILEHRGASAVIDPVGIAGPRELDVASAALYNNWGEESSARIRRLAKLTGTDPAFARCLVPGPSPDRFGSCKPSDFGEVECRHETSLVVANCCPHVLRRKCCRRGGRSKHKPVTGLTLAAG